MAATGRRRGQRRNQKLSAIIDHHLTAAEVCARLKTVRDGKGHPVPPSVARLCGDAIEIIYRQGGEIDSALGAGRRAERDGIIAMIEARKEDDR